MDNYSLDIENEYKKSRSIFLRYSLLFSFILTIVLVSDVLLVIFANEDYLINLIISIIISALFSWFAIYFFTNIYNDINAKYRYFKGYASGIQETDEVIIVDNEDEGKQYFINGLYVYPIYVKYVSNLDGTDKIIYSFQKDLDLKKGDKLTVTTYQRILVKMRKHL